MARGFLAGVIWGGLVAGAAGVGLSVTGPAPRTPPSDLAPATPETETQALAGPEVGTGMDTGAPAVDAAPETMRSAPEAPEGGSAQSDLPETPDRPAIVDAASDGPEAPAAPEGAEAPVAAPSVDTAPAGGATAPVLLPGTFEAAPDASDSTAAVDAETRDPDAPTAPEATEEGPPAAPSAEVPGEATVAPGQASAPDGPETVPDTPERPEAASADPGAPASPDVPDEGEGPASVPDDAPRVTARVAPPGAPDPEAAPELATDPAVPPVGEGEDQALRPAIGRPAGSFIERDPAVSERRLPTVGAEADAPEATAATPTQTPLERFSAEAEAPDGVPRMAVVLLDDGSGPLGPEGLEAFPFPVSFAIAPGHPEAAAAAREYRARGFEVLAVGDVPEGATASDVEVTLTGLLDAVPEAVAVIEAPGAGLQSSREVSGQTTAFLAASGHGLLMQSKGLNTAQQLALREGVPSASVFRDLDGEGQDQSLIRRALDQSAFRARQEGSVVLLGRLRADTISALLLWGLQDRSNEIALVPVSTVLRESVEAE